MFFFLPLRLRFANTNLDILNTLSDDKAAWLYSPLILIHI